MSMGVEIIVFAEGQSEEAFIKQLVAPALRPMNLFVKPQTLPTSRKASGGAVNFDRLKFHAINTLRQNKNTVLSTFLDLYALENDFPEHAAAGKISDVHQRIKMLEQAMHTAIIAHVGCRADRFIPHIQPYEFEGLLFSDVSALVQVESGWPAGLQDLQEVRAQFATPEHINNSYETKPSKRLENLLRPRYKKIRHGPLIAKAVGLAAIEKECPHFKTWMDSLRSLAK